MPTINNIEQQGITELWQSLLPWQADLPWFYPTYQRINNIEANV